MGWNKMKWNKTSRERVGEWEIKKFYISTVVFNTLNSLYFGKYMWNFWTTFQHNIHIYCLYCHHLKSVKSVHSIRLATRLQKIRNKMTKTNIVLSVSRPITFVSFSNITIIYNIIGLRTVKFFWMIQRNVRVFVFILLFDFSMKILMKNIFNSRYNKKQQQINDKIQVNIVMAWKSGTYWMNDGMNQNDCIVWTWIKNVMIKH